MYSTSLSIARCMTNALKRRENFEAGHVSNPTKGAIEAVHVCHTMQLTNSFVLKQCRKNSSLRIDQASRASCLDGCIGKEQLVLIPRCKLLSWLLQSCWQAFAALFQDRNHSRLQDKYALAPVHGLSFSHYLLCFSHFVAIYFTPRSTLMPACFACWSSRSMPCDFCKRKLRQEIERVDHQFQ